MVQIQDAIGLVSGSPQFRIKESMDKAAPAYIYYGQPEIEDDLVDLKISRSEHKKIKTFDKVNTVREGDVLFSLISGKTTLVRKIHEGYLFTQNYVKLIPNREIVPEYLIYLLNEDTSIQYQFQTGLQGSMVLKYTLKQLREIELPKLPLLEKQKVIGELYLNQLRLYALRERAARAETTVIFAKLKEAKA